MSRRAAALFLVSLLACSGGATSLPENARADRIVITKSKHQLTLLQRDRPLKSYRVALGPNPRGHKEQQGDGRTPEGTYRIIQHKRDSAYHRALRIDYPSARDRREAARRHVDPGGDIMIHGLPNGAGAIGSAHVARDWTAGCIAVTNEEIEEIFRAVKDGTPVEIRP